MPKMTARQWMIIILISTGVLAPPLLWKYFRPSARLNRAVRVGDISRVENMLASNPALLDSRDARQKAAPLQWAVVENRPEIVKLLIDRGADVNARDRSDMTALHSATIFNRVDMLRWLIDAGADLDAKCLSYNAIRMTPLHKAVEAGSYDAVKVLLDAGADVNVRTEGSNQVTPLHVAAARGRQGIIRMLVEYDADLNPRDVTGATPVRWAVKMDQNDTAALLRLFGGRE